ncbi:hypothetical protein ACP70R_042363 [Stipagrostis hirtigluma subsp. patula]
MEGDGQEPAASKDAAARSSIVDEGNRLMEAIGKVDYYLVDEPTAFRLLHNLQDIHRIGARLDEIKALVAVVSAGSDGGSVSDRRARADELLRQIGEVSAELDVRRRDYFALLRVVAAAAERPLPTGEDGPTAAVVGGSGAATSIQVEEETN